VYTLLDSGLWAENLSETFRVPFQNKFEKLVHLVGFIIRLDKEDSLILSKAQRGRGTSRCLFSGYVVSP
jgi:hypothetical protein